MAYSHSFLESAQEEYEQAIYWYLERSRSAAENFITAIDYTLDLICDNPTRWRNEYSNYFELGLKKYPFSIIYIIDDHNARVIIVSVFHHKRSPKKKYIKPVK